MKFMTTLFACLIFCLTGCSDSHRTSVKVVPTPCSHHNDCPEDKFCAMQDDFEGICAHGCVVDANCAEGEICEGNYCVVGQRDEENPVFNIDVNVERPEPQPQEERCDGKDNDLDGLTDEDCDSFCGDGICETEEKESFSTCPEDCSVACEAIYDCIPSAFDPGFSECPNCGNCLEIACISGMCALLPADQDGDGHSPDFCGREFDDDCDYLDPSIHPGAQETCDGLDNNCNGTIDEGCEDDDADDDGYTPDNNDCNDNDPAIHPGAYEECDGLDNDCDGQTDEGFPFQRFLRDADGDGYGNPDEYIEAADCITPPPDGYIDWAVGLDNDCDDSNPNTNPGAMELCDGLDNDCDGQVDEGCSEPEEACDGVDNDNDHAIDEGCPCEDPNPDYWIDRDCGYAMPAGIWSFGFQSCDNGYWTECFGVPAPGEQICNSTNWMWVTDHDADGLVGCDDPDCQDSLLCQNFCVDDSECDAGYACVDNMCVSSVPALCETDDDCVGQLWGPYCVYSQVDDISYCQACLQDIPGEQQYSVDGISPGCDSELPVCAWGVQGVPISEQHPSGQVSFYWCTECGSQMPCPDGQSCVVGECVPDESCQPDPIIDFAADTPSGNLTPSMNTLVAKVNVSAGEEVHLDHLLLKVSASVGSPDDDVEQWTLKNSDGDIVSVIFTDITGSDSEVHFTWSGSEYLAPGQNETYSVFVDTTEMTTPNDSLQLWMITSCDEELYAGALVKP
jgi:hypothetical protein